MKTAKLFIVLAALLCATAAWAQTIISTEEDLRTAVQISNVGIKLANDINLGDLIEITDNRTVAIDMDGHTLNRGRTSRDWDHGGQVFAVREGATLNLSNGTLTGGWGGDSGGIDNYGTANLTDVTITGCTGDDRGGGICNREGGTLTMTGGSITGNTSNDRTTPEGGGGIFNTEGATMTLTGVTITGNVAKVKGGGAICNFGSLTLDGCTITGNTCGKNGGGIYNAATATLNMQGKMTVTDNSKADGTTNNLFLKTDAVITVTGSLAGSSIGVNLEKPGVFTNGYNANNSGVDPTTLFTSDDAQYTVTLSGEEINLLGVLTTVTTEKELVAAVQIDNANIKLGNDINLTDILGIAEDMTVTIDLGGFTLDRGCLTRDGQAIVVENGATLNLSNGTVKGGWGGDGGGIQNKSITNLTNVTLTGNVADDRGGGIWNGGGATLSMKGCTVTGNTCNAHPSDGGGGGIYNSEDATTTLDGCTVTGNTTNQYDGGGICNYGTLNMQGANNVTGNIGYDHMTNNLFLKKDKVITLTGALTGSTVGISMETAGAFTTGYNANNSGVDPTTLFSADLPEVMAISLDADNEAQLASTLPDGDIYYIECSWDDANKVVKAETKILKSDDYAVMHGGGDDADINAGYHVVKNNVEYGVIHCTGGGKHHLILCDGARISAEFVRVEDDNELYIYGQAHGTGQLSIDGDQESHHAGIGTAMDKHAGTIVIHGGDINTSGSVGGAGIGGGEHCNGGTITIYGGTIHATGNGNYEKCGAGIGGGEQANGGTITIYGGHIKAEVVYGGAGIGSGNNYGGGGADGPFYLRESEYHPVDGGDITIYGGDIEAYGNQFGAGIGGGCNGGGGNITINGGIVKAWGGVNGSGIGSGEKQDDAFTHTGTITVNGGVVYGYGGDDGAGIGGGYDANGADFTINGGYVYAKGDGNGAGIGSGCESIYTGGLQSGKFTATGGHVEAYGGTDAAGIGGGEDADCGTVTISGGYIYAHGNDWGAGIGGGQGGDGGNVTITGGTVIAKAGRDETECRAIGPGEQSDVYGSLTIGDEMMVSSERMAVAAERHDMCWYRTQVRVEPCTHPDHTYIVDGTTAEGTHTEQCQYCTTPFEPEKHNFVDDVCTVCGAQQTVDDATGIETMSDVKCKMSDVWFDLSGRKLSGKPTTKGIYINKGKKVKK